MHKKRYEYVGFDYQQFQVDGLSAVTHTIDRFATTVGL
jgi:hypothetical protein